MPPIILVGPTASGKSALALELAVRIGGEIISCDARQIYREANIVTAKPTRRERETVPHHLVDVCNPDERFSALQWADAARNVLIDIEQRGKRAIICGGTGFYLRALIQPESFDAPASSPQLRAALETWIAHETQKRDLLKKVAPEIAPGDTFRLIRALEIALLRGDLELRAELQNISSTKPIFDALDESKPFALSSTKPSKPFVDAPIYALEWPRAALYERINSRVDEMLAMGADEEARTLRQKWGEDAPFASGVGYKQLWAFVDERISRNEAMEEWKRESRRYAKRQMTWFRHQIEATWLDASRGVDEMINEILATEDTENAQSGTEFFS